MLDRAFLVGPDYHSVTSISSTVPLPSPLLCHCHFHLSATGIASLPLYHRIHSSVELQPRLTPLSDSCASSTPQTTAPAGPPSPPLPQAAHSPTRLDKDRDNPPLVQAGSLRISRRYHRPDRRGSSPPRTLSRCVRFFLREPQLGVDSRSDAVGDGSDELLSHCVRLSVEERLMRRRRTRMRSSWEPTRAWTSTSRGLCISLRWVRVQLCQLC